MITPDEYCRQITEQSASGFHQTSRFLPPDRRRAITALYAFCREIDDTVDMCASGAEARLLLASWRNEVSGTFAGRPQHAVMRALHPHIDPCQLREHHMLAIIDGMQMDLDQSRYEDYAALQRYCWNVAGVVGMLSASVYGVTHPRTLQYAAKLGMACQLIHIMRDVGEHARMGRIYLPQQELQRFGVDADDLAEARHGRRFERLLRFQAERAKNLYHEAMALLPAEDRRAQRPGLVMASIHLTLLGKIERASFRVLDRRMSLSASRKLWLALKTCVAG